MQQETVIDTDEDDPPFNDFERGFLSAVLFMHGVTAHPSFEEFSEAMWIMEAYSFAVEEPPATRN